MGFRTVVVILPDGTVGQAQLADHSVGPLQLEDHAVGPTQIADHAVGTPQLAAAAVGAAQVADHAIGPQQLDIDALDNKTAYGVLVATTDTTGRLSWPHPLGSTPAIALAQVADTTPGLRLTVAALSATTVTWRAYDTATSTPAANTAVNAYVWACR